MEAQQNTNHRLNRIQEIEVQIVGAYPQNAKPSMLCFGVLLNSMGRILLKSCMPSV